MPFQRGKEFMLRYSYDFARDGGATASPIALTPQLNAIEEGLVIKEVIVLVDTLLDSGGSPTVTLGNTNDPDGYMADFYALVSGAGKGAVMSGEVAGALIWDDTNDHAITYAVDSDADNQDLVLDIGTAALTAGKLTILVKCVKE